MTALQMVRLFDGFDVFDHRNHIKGCYRQFRDHRPVGKVVFDLDCVGTCVIALPTVRSMPNGGREPPEVLAIRRFHQAATSLRIFGCRTRLSSAHHRCQYH